MKIYTCFCVLVFTIVSYNANAEDKKVYAGIQASILTTDTEQDAKDQAQAMANFFGSTVYYTYEESTLAGRVFAGYDISDKFAVELGYFNSMSVEATYKSTTSGTAWEYTQSVETSGVDIAGLFRLGKVYYIKAGMHSSRLDGVESFTAAGSTYAGTAEASGSGFLFGGGYKGEISPNNTFWTGDVTHYDSLGGVSDVSATFWSLTLGMYF